MIGKKAKYIKHLEDKLQEMANPRVLAAHLKDGVFDLRLESPIAHIIAAFFWEMLEGTTTGTYAPNCVQIKVGNPVNGHLIEITARRHNGKMPTQIAVEARMETERLEAELAEEREAREDLQCAIEDALHVAAADYYSIPSDPLMSPWCDLRAALTKIQKAQEAKSDG